MKTENIIIMALGGYILYKSVNPSKIPGGNSNLSPAPFNNAIFKTKPLIDSNGVNRGDWTENNFSPAPADWIKSRTIPKSENPFYTGSPKAKTNTPIPIPIVAPKTPAQPPQFIDEDGVNRGDWTEENYSPAPAEWISNYIKY